MPQITPEKQRKMLAAAEIVDKGGMAVLEKIIEFEDRTEESEIKVTKCLEKINEVLETVSETLANVKDGEPGEPGKDYVLTDLDKKDIAQKILVPVVDKVIERTEVIKEQPIVTTEIVKETTRDMTESPEQIRNKLESLDGEERLDKSAIKGLDEELKKIGMKASSPTSVFGRAGVQILSNGSKVGTKANIINIGSGITVTNVNGLVTLSVVGVGTWYENEVLARTDGTNYTLANTPSSVAFIFLNGQQTSDYVRIGSAVTMNTPTLASDVITATYS